MGLGLCLGFGCRHRVHHAAHDTPPDPRSAMRAPQPAPSIAEPFSPRALVRCFQEDLSGAPARALGALLDRASERHDHADYATSLTCAEEAARVDPRSVEAHEDRALALVELDRKDESRAAIGRALAIDPDDPHTLVSAADLLLNRFAAKGEVASDDAAAALEHALRGLAKLRHARGKLDRALRARLELLSGQALSDLGRAKEAVPHLDAAIAAAPDDLTSRYERGVALFDLCRFRDAEKSLREVVEKDPSDAFAHQQLGLTLEQLGDEPAAAHELAEALRLDPTEIHASVDVSRPEFEKMVHDEVDALAPNLKADLARVALELPDLPRLDDLTADDPPLPPTIVGLFRGGPLPEATGAVGVDAARRAPTDSVRPDDEHRAIALYRLNLVRTVQSKQELREQIRTTLHHELGHLRGEDDDALRARGLE